MASGLQALLSGLCFLLAVGAWLAESAPTGAHFFQQTMLVHLPTYLCLSYCYYNFAQLGQTSLRVNLLRILRSKPEGIPLDSLTQQYGDHQAIPLRVGRLVTTGDLVESDGGLTVGRSRFVFTGLILFGLKRFLLGKNFDFKVAPSLSMAAPKP